MHDRVRPPTGTATVEALARIAKQMMWLTLVFPVLVLPAFGFAFVIALRGRREMALVIFVLSAVSFGLSLLVWSLVVYLITK